MGQVVSELAAGFEQNNNSVDGVTIASSSWGWTSVAAGLFLALVVLCHLGDIALMIRFIWICSIAPALRLAPSKPSRTAFLKEHVHHATVTTRDLDLMFHMNNARYLREADFARHELLVACGLFQAAWKRRTPFVTASQTIRYRKELKFGTKYRIVTSIVGWDEKCVLIQQVFVTSGRSHRHPHAPKEGGAGKNDSDDIVHAVLIVREGMAGGGRAHHHHHHHHSAHPDDNNTQGKTNAAAVNPLSSATAAKTHQGEHPSAAGPFRTLLESLGWDKDSPDGKHKALPLSRNPPTDVMEWLHSTLETSTRVVDGGKPREG